MSKAATSTQKSSLKEPTSASKNKPVKVVVPSKLITGRSSQMNSGKKLKPSESVPQI